MNNYEVTKCPKCGEAIITSEIGTVKVAGWKNLETVLRYLQDGGTLEEVGKDYCSVCLFPITEHATREEHEKRPEWLPYHEPEPQADLNRYV